MLKDWEARQHLICDKMCGIVGKYSFNNPLTPFVKGEQRPVSNDLLHDMCDVIVHRGPDDEGYYINGNIGLGMRRLSIIDLQTGNQPIHNESNQIWIVYNGEVYNCLFLRAELENRRRGRLLEREVEHAVGGLSNTHFIKIA